MLILLLFSALTLFALGYFGIMVREQKRDIEEAKELTQRFKENPIGMGDVIPYPMISEQTPLRPHHFIEHQEKGTAHSLKAFSCVPAESTEFSMQLECQASIQNFTFSGSGVAKFILKKNGIALGTFFNTLQNLQVTSDLMIRYQFGDTLAIEFLNREYVASQDLYAGFEMFKDGLSA